MDFLWWGFVSLTLQVWLSASKIILAESLPYLEKMCGFQGDFMVALLLSPCSQSCWSLENFTRKILTLDANFSVVGLCSILERWKISPL